MHVSSIDKKYWDFSQPRPKEIQDLIDESWNVFSLPLQEGVIQGRYLNYFYKGQEEDYTFQTPDLRVAGIKATKVAEEFAKKEKFAVLDLGCGVGTFLETLKNRFPNVEVMGVSGVDFRKTNWDKNNVKLSDNEYVVGNIENLSQIQALKGKKFDLIVSHMAFLHLSDRLRDLADAYDFLEENGILLIDKFDLNLTVDGKRERLITLKGKTFSYTDEPGEGNRNDYKDLFKDSGCTDVEIIADPLNNSIIQTKIRKRGLEHLIFPVEYDLSKSTRVEPDHQAQIFYKRKIKNLTPQKNTNCNVGWVALATTVALCAMYVSLASQS